MIIENGILKKIEEKDVINGIIVVPHGVSIIDSHLIDKSDILISSFSFDTEDDENIFPNNIKKIYIPKTVKEIKKMAFMGLGSIEQIDFEEGIQLNEIGANAFNGCYSLKEISIPQTVTTIDVDAFRGCSNIRTLSFPKDSTVIISDSSFENCNELVEIHFFGKAKKCDDNKEGRINLIAKNIKELTVFNKEIIENMKERLEAITIPKGVKKIDDETFFNYLNLKKVKLPNGIEDLGDSAFIYCFRLEEINIPESVKYIGKSCFESTGLKSINIPGSLLEINDEAFSCCINLINVNIAEGVRNIGKKAFTCCTKLTTVNLPRSVEIIQKHAFFWNHSLKKVKVPYNTKIDNEAFSNECLKVRDNDEKKQSTDDDGR